MSVGFGFLEVGDLEAARRELERAWADAERVGLPAVSARARQNLALVRAADGALDDAQRMLREVLDETILHGNLRFAAWTRIYLANVALARGDAAAAERFAMLAAEALVSTPPARAGALAAAARALVAAGRPDEALAAAQEAVSVLDDLGGIEEFESLVRLAHVEALRASGDVAAASTAARAARQRIESRAATLGEPYPAWFIERVDENRRLLALAAELA